MKIIVKYLKSFAIGFALAIALLFVQAICDLNLPNYMSNIVNVGIQQNGIEHASPNAISQDGMKFVKTFVSDEDREKLAHNYILKDNDKELYPNSTDKLYVLIDGVNSETRSELDLVFGHASWTFIKTMEKTNDNSAETMENNIAELDISKLYEMQPMFEMIPSETINEASKAANSVDQMILEQSGMIMAKAFSLELGVDLNKMQTNYIIKIGTLMLGIALISGGATIVVNLLSSRIATGVARNMRSDLFKKIEQFSNVEYDKVSTASLITRCTNDVMQVQALLMMGIRLICYAPIMAIGGVFMAYRTAPSMSWVIALAVVVALVVVVITVAIAMPKFKIIQKLVDRVNLISREGLSGLMVVRAFSTEKYEEKRFNEANMDLAKTNLFVNRVMVLMMPIMMFIMNGLTVLVVWVGAHQIAESNMQIGDMMAFIQYAMHVLMSFLMMSMMFIMVPRAAVSAERIHEILKIDIEIEDPENPQEFMANQKGLVEFRNVRFRYHDAQEDALENINFVAKPNEITAIIGSTGSGKTTIANLLMRFFDVTSGSIMVNGVDIREVEQEALHKKIGYVPQKGLMLSGSIASNIKYGNPHLNDEEMVRIADVAQATEFIETKTEKYNDEIAQGGKNVSGGQKQRLAIARALAIKPEILLFDDSFSALDYKTDLALRKSINENIKDLTFIVVAQRISTIKHADNILVVDKGRIVGQGKHEELLKTCQEYFEIAKTQLSKEELGYE